jgi:hypothetical protein
MLAATGHGNAGGALFGAVPLHVFAGIHQKLQTRSADDLWKDDRNASFKVRDSRGALWA